MQLFVEFRNFYRMMDIEPPQHKKNKKRASPSPLTLKICLSIFVLVTVFILTGFFCLFQSKTMREFGDSFYVTASAPGVLWVVLIFFVNSDDIFTVIEQFEEFVERSSHLLHLYFDHR